MRGQLGRASTPARRPLEQVRERYGAPSKETKQKVDNYDTTRWIYEGDKAPSGINRMIVDFGILKPDGFKPNLVRVFTIEPRPTIFAVQTVVDGWGLPAAPANQNGYPTMVYEAGLVVVFDKETLWAGSHDLHRAPAAAAAVRDQRRARSRSSRGTEARSAQTPEPARRPAPLERIPQQMVDRLLAFDPGGRGIARFFVPGGAARAAHALRRAKRVLLTTGFSVGPGLPETDGPPGTASLGRALRALGAEVTYITDAAALPPLQAALAALGEPTQILTFHAGGDAALTARRLLAEHAPTHLVSIERPGRTRGGEYLSMRGESVGEWNGALDELFVQAPRRVVTVGVGDGGNEIGMGALRARLARAGARVAQGRVGRRRAARGRRRRLELGRLRHRRRAGAPLEASAAAHGGGGATHGARLRGGGRGGRHHAQA